MAIGGGPNLNRGLCIAGGLLLGVAVGAGIVILLTPKSGAETRQAIQDRVSEVIETGRQAGARASASSK